MRAFFALCAALAAAASHVGAFAAPAEPPPQQQQAGAVCPAILQYSFDRLQDEKPQALCQYAGRVLLVVNTASFCGFTKQYQGLEDLYARYRERGLVVLGFPSNDFSQEGGSNQQIAAFCENTFGVKFPMFAKSSVVGPEASAFYRTLAAQSNGQRPAWNFHKYLLGRDGRVIASYPSKVAPDDPRLLAEIEKQLALR